MRNELPARPRARACVAACCAALLAASMTVAVPTTAIAQGFDDGLTAEEQALARTIASGETETGSIASARALTDYWMWPLPGIGEDHISQTFQSGHGALDIWAEKGTPIVASRAGIVVATEATNPMELDGYGNCVVVHHQDGTESYYAHMDARAVEAGSVVAQGQVIGYVGNTGQSFGDHLHFEIRVNATPEEFYWGERIDPLPFVSGHTDPAPDAGGAWFVDVDFDDPGCWYAEPVKEAVELGLMVGSDGRFRPDDDISRGEVYTILYRATGAEAAEGTSGRFVENQSPFTDNVDGAFYTAAINWAARTGMASTVNEAVRPDDPISREELAVLMERYAEVACGQAVPSGVALPEGIADLRDVSDWAVEAMAWAYENGIMTGREQSDGTALLQPKDTATRAEMAKVIVRTLEVAE